MMKDLKVYLYQLSAGWADADDKGKIKPLKSDIHLHLIISIYLMAALFWEPEYLMGYS